MGGGTTLCAISQGTNFGSWKSGLPLMKMTATGCCCSLWSWTLMGQSRCWRWRNWRWQSWKSSWEVTKQWWHWRSNWDNILLHKRWHLGSDWSIFENCFWPRWRCWLEHWSSLRRNASGVASTACVLAMSSAVVDEPEPAEPPLSICTSSTSGMMMSCCLYNGRKSSKGQDRAKGDALSLTLQSSSAPSAWDSEPDSLYMPGGRSQWLYRK